MSSDWLNNLCSRLPGLPAGGAAGGPRGLRDGRGATAPSSPAEVYPASGKKSLQKWAGAALATLLFLITAAPAFSSSQGDYIVNSAKFSAAGNVATATSVTATVVIRTSAKIELLKYAPLFAGAVKENVAVTSYRTGSDPAAPFTAMPPPVPAGLTTPIDLNKPVPIAPADVFHQCEPIFVRVTDPDQNLDRSKADTVLVTLSDSASGDAEVLRLTETGPDTGVFTGYLQTAGNICQSNPLPMPFNGTLPVSEATNISAVYRDRYDNTDTASGAAVVDPFGIVFDSQSGKPVDGAVITLLDAATGKAAAVLGDDGVSAFPATVTTGATTSDASGRRYDFPPGGFRFPFVNPGTYQFQVTPPPGFTVPSTSPDATLRALPGGPFAIVTPGSRLEPFTINPGPAIHIDIPLDPLVAKLWLQKTAGKTLVASGDFLPYDLSLQNLDDKAVVPGVTIEDTLPLGFRYQKGSTKINGFASPDPAISADGRTLTFTLGEVAAKATGNARYVVEVAAGARPGSATNQAVARSAVGAASNVAKAIVQVRSDFLNSRSILMGQVIAGGCGAQEETGLAGVAGVRIFLEDGTFVDTDKRGMFHFEGVRPGTHVVQLDLDSLPADYRIVPCEENSRFAGTSYSQFVDLQGGTIWRADFHVARKAKLKGPEPEKVVPPLEKGEVDLELTSSLYGEIVVYQALLQGHAVPKNNLQLNVTLPEGVAYEAGSSQLDGVPLADPAIAGSELTYPLGSRPGDWSGKLRFRAILPRSGAEGDLPSRATVAMEGRSEVGPLPIAENVLRRFREESRIPVPDFVIHPRFPTFGAELSEDDRRQLDDLARLLMVLNIERITVTGHTDNVRIAGRSRGIYRDNNSLSLARAESVRRYLIEALHLPSSKLEVDGKGETMPIADNRSEKGRRLNRRVEVKVRTERVIETTRHEPVKLESGIQRTELIGQPPPPSPSPGTEEKDAPESAKVQKDENGIEEKEGLLSPRDNATLIYRINGVRVCIPVALTPRLLLDDKEVPAGRIGFTMKDNKSGKAIYSYIGVDFGEEGEHTLRLQGVDPFGNARFDRAIKVRRSGEITAIRLKSAEGNIADGRTPVKLQLELLDASGHVIPAEAELEIRGGTLKTLKKESSIPDPMSGPIERVPVDAEGNVLFQPVNGSGLYRVVFGHNKVTLEAETYVKPNMRDWILVGLGEGTIGYNTVAGHMENLRDSGQEEDFYENGRLAFFAKGKVKGEWLLTMAYDSAKGRGEVGNSLFQTINPETFYTLYGDASQQQYDAASARKLYLKIERDQFYALFGDFDTGLTVTELSRYSRRLNGLKAEWQGKNFEANVFGSETAQSFTRDELRGDGTSGLYRLSRRNIVFNSDKITIETRDRFRSEIIVDSRVMTRFTDYSIDYDAGTIFFKEPIRSRDDNFNPVFIVVEYETFNAGAEALTYGGRVGAKLFDQKLRTGFTYIHEGQVSGEGNSYGLDATYMLGTGTTMKGEIARTDTDFGGTTREGNAYLAEVQHNSPKLQSKLYFREQENGFGLGQQNGTETGTRKAGFDAAYKLTEIVGLGGQAYRQYNLATGAVQDVIEGKSTYTSGPYGAHLGLRHASDTLGDGSVKTSEQLTMGGSWLTLDKRLTLRADHDQSIGDNDNATFPTRTILGADFKLTEKVSLFAQQEFTSSAGAETNATRLGMKSTPWGGGAFNTSMERNLTENADRLFALFGLKQTWKVTDKWSVDGGVDRSQTIRNAQNYTFNVNVPPASGENQDFTAVSLGTSYTEKKWAWNNRLEVRTSDIEDKWGFLTSYVGEPREGWGWSARFQIFDTASTAGSSTVNSDLRLGLVHRPLQTRWIILDRLDFLYSRQQGTALNIESRRIVNNLNANFKPDKKTQISLQYGAKYVLETIDEQDYSGYTDLIGVEGRYDLTKDWDIGLRGSVLHSWNSGQFNYSSGPSVGYSVVKNAWVSLGYNLIGFTDKDFSTANFTAQGPFVHFRFKFDQNSVKEAANWINRE